MNKNLGKPDVIIRLIIAALCLGLIFAGVSQGVVTIILGVVAAAMVLTSLINWCPIYAVTGLSTRKTPKA